MDHASKTLVIFFKVTTNRTPQHSFISVSVVVSSHRTRSRPSALRKLIFCVLAHIVSITLSLMARFTKMCISPTEPLSYAAAKLALKLYEIFSMFGTIFYRHIAATWANQLFWLKTSSCSLSFIHSRHTVLPTSEVRIFALKAHKVCIYDHRILICLPVIGRSFIL